MNARFVFLSNHLVKLKLSPKTNYSLIRNYLANNLKNSCYLNNPSSRCICISVIRLANNDSTKPSSNSQSDKTKIFSSSVVEHDGRSSQNQVSTHLSPGRKAKQAAKDASYGVVILMGGLTLIAIFYYLFTELFSRETPTGIFDESSKMCLDNFEVRDALGTPIKVTAESGGRRVFQIKHKYYIEDGSLFLIINYYLEGPKNKGTVYCKVKKNETSGKFEYESIIVKLDYPHRGQRKILVQHKDSPVTGSAPIGGGSF